MSRTARLLLFLAGAAGTAALLGTAIAGMPAFGGSTHPYRDLAVPAAVRHATANVVSSVNFDQRAIDTLGEETILLGSVVGAAALLRPAEREEERRPAGGGRTLEATRLLGYLLLPVTLMVGMDLVAHGHLTPGGGFQGGVVLATGLHLLYLTGSYPALQRLRPAGAFDAGEGAGAAAFAGLGLAGTALTGFFLANVIPQGTFGRLLSAGTVPVLNAVVGLEVACGTAVLLTGFFAQEITVVRVDRPTGGGG